MNPTSEVPAIGTILDNKFRLTRLLGRGGMGAVFEATHIGLDKAFAIKWLSRSDLSLHKRVLHEAQMNAKVRHRHVVEVYDIGQDHDACFIVMELVEGETLEARLKRAARLEIREACRLLIEIARGLHAAHCAGVAHGDVKPNNVLLTRDGTPKLADFGVARRVQLGASANTLDGTAYYMPLELLLGAAADVRSDVYALAVLAFQLITGELPFAPFPHEDRILQLQMLPVPSLRERVRAPRGLARVVARAMAHASEDRFASVAEFARALEPFADGTRFSCNLTRRSVTVRRICARWLGRSADSETSRSAAPRSCNLESENRRRSNQQETKSY